MDHVRIDALFDQALAQPPGQRLAWLAAACGEDAELHRTVSRLLQADARAEGVLEHGAGLIAQVMVEATAAPRRFGVWRVLRGLGAGGMGEVWLAERDDAGFVQRAAIKQVAWPTPGLLERFRRERQILAQLEHPSIARLIDGGVDTAGCPWLAMEYVEGTPISDWVRERALDPHATVKLLVRLCEAVQVAHRNLVVHSDIKPSNVLVAADGSPKLLDFGVATVLAGDGDPGRAATATRLLTPDYAAPELLAGAGITTVVDVYALGVLGYELLAGGKPYRLVGGPVPPPVRPPSAAISYHGGNNHARRRMLRGDLDRIVLTAMAADPGQRYASVETLAADLQRWLEGRAISVRGDSAWYRLRKFAARNRVAVGAAVAIVLVLSCATAYSTWQARIARQQMHRAEAVRQFLANTFAQIDPARNQGQQVGLHQLLEASERRLASAGMPTAVRADLTTLIGTFYWNLADNTASERALESAVAMGAGGGVPDDVQARALATLARVEQDRSDYAAAYRHAERAYALALRGDATGGALTDTARHMLAALTVEHSGAARAEPALRALLADDRARHGARSQVVVDDLIVLGHALDTMARYQEAEAALQEAVATARELGGPYFSSLGLALDYLGIIRQHRGDYAGARRAFDECSRVTGQLWGASNVRSSIVRGQLLEVTVRQGQLATALPAVVAMREEARRLRQDRPDHYAATLQLLGKTRLGLGRLPQAEAAYRDAIVAWSKVPAGGQSPDAADALAGLAATLQLQGRLGEAEKAARRAIAIDEASAATPSQQLARHRAGLAGILRLRGRHTEAAKQTTDALARLRGARGSDSPDAMLVRAQAALTLLDDHQARQAHAQAAAAMAIGARVLPPGNWQWAPALLALGRAELALGHAAAAETALRRGLALRDPLQPASDPRVLELRVALIRALDMQHKDGEATAQRAAIEPLLARTAAPYAMALRQRLAAR
jgi:serine/threonine-protein kinase